MLTCFVGPNWLVYSQNEKGTCFEYQFNLETRAMTFVRGGPFSRELRHDAVARNYFDNLIGTPDKLMAFAAKGELTKLELAALLMPEKRKVYLNICTRFEKALTEACTATGDPCLEEGCAVEGEVCLSAVIRDDELYKKGCAFIWSSMFASPENRIPVWRS